MIKKKEVKLVLWWIAIGAVAAAITKDAPHTNRMFAVVPAMAMAVALGIVDFLRLVEKRWQGVFVVILLIGYIASMTYYLDRYFTHFPKTEAANWGYAYKKLTSLLYASPNIGKYVIMTRPETSPYIYIMFYIGYNPASYQREARRYPVSSDGFTDVAGFGRFSFRPINWPIDAGRHNTLLVVQPDEVHDAMRPNIVNTIQLPDGTPQFIIIDPDKYR